jgi:hypothetical protein
VVLEQDEIIGEFIYSLQVIDGEIWIPNSFSEVKFGNKLTKPKIFARLAQLKEADRG